MALKRPEPPSETLSTLLSSDVAEKCEWCVAPLAWCRWYWTLEKVCCPDCTHQRRPEPWEVDAMVAYDAESDGT